MPSTDDVSLTIKPSTINTNPKNPKEGTNGTAKEDKGKDEFNPLTLEKVFEINDKD
jgi:hypothetical protein